MGRMGVIYSMVIQVVPQFLLQETRTQSTWATVSASSQPGAPTSPSGSISDLLSTIGPPPGNRFLQLLVLPYRNSDGSRTCFVTTRTVPPTNTRLNPASTGGFFAFACQLQPLGKIAVVASIIAAAWALYFATSWIPFVSGATLAAAVAVTLLLAPLTVPSITLGNWIAAVTNLMTQFGLFGVATSTVNALLSSQQNPTTTPTVDLSFKVMDTYNPNAQCYLARSIEVAFDANKSDYIDYLNNDVFPLIDLLANSNQLFGVDIPFAIVDSPRPCWRLSSMLRRCASRSPLSTGCPVTWSFSTHSRASDFQVSP